MYIYIYIYICMYIYIYIYIYISSETFKSLVGKPSQDLLTIILFVL